MTRLSIYQTQIDLEKILIRFYVSLIYEIEMTEIGERDEARVNDRERK